MDSLESRVGGVVEAMKRASLEAGRSERDITLVAVSKGHDAEHVSSVITLLKKHEIDWVLGENYVQEYQLKKSFISEPHSCHMIGRLQSNKVKASLDVFQCIQSVHSKKLAIELNKEASKRGVRLPIYLQINISNDRNKSGIIIGECEELLSQIAEELPSLHLSGLMTITEFYEEPSMARVDFRKMCFLKEKMEKVLHTSLALSMGMSQDFKEAIYEGATHVRIGTALFGERVLAQQ